MVDQKLFSNSKPNILLFSTFLSLSVLATIFLSLSFLLFFRLIFTQFSSFLSLSLFLVLYSFLSLSSLIFLRFLFCNSHLLSFLSFSRLFFSHFSPSFYGFLSIPHPFPLFCTLFSLFSFISLFPHLFFSF